MNKDGNNDKWKMFKNFLHNEMGISKEDIREWVHESVKIQVENIVANSFKRFSLENFLERQYIKGLRDNDRWETNDIKREIAKIIAKNIKVVVEDKK